MTSTNAQTETVRHTVSQLAIREGVHAATIWRWILTGVRGLKLRAVRVGGRRFVNEFDWLAFSAALNADLADAPEEKPAEVTVANSTGAAR